MLYIVATPIGNLGDTSARAKEILSSADLIACEDTRRSGLLLNHLGIKRPLISYHDHNEASRTAELTEKLQSGLNLALITDAGTPLLSDPGYRIVSACHDLNIPCSVIPGPCAITTALAGSGLPPQPFYFGGFLPVKSGRREKELTRALTREATSIYYESPHRILKSLQVLKDLAPDHLACVARELTKTFEEFRRDTTGNLCDHYQTKPPKGEITLLIAPGKEN